MYEKGYTHGSMPDPDKQQLPIQGRITDGASYDQVTFNVLRCHSNSADPDLAFSNGALEGILCLLPSNTCTLQHTVQRRRRVRER